MRLALDLSDSESELIAIVRQFRLLTISLAVSPDLKLNHLDMEIDRIYGESMLKLSAKGVSPVHTRAREDLKKRARDWTSGFNLGLALKDCDILIVSCRKAVSSLGATRFWSVLVREPLVSKAWHALQWKCVIGNFLNVNSLLFPDQSQRLLRWEKVYSLWHFSGSPKPSYICM